MNVKNGLFIQHLLKIIIIDLRVKLFGESLFIA